jgi:hypothetical protein
MRGFGHERRGVHSAVSVFSPIGDFDLPNRLESPRLGAFSGQGLEAPILGFLRVGISTHRSGFSPLRIGVFFGQGFSPPKRGFAPPVYVFSPNWSSDPPASGFDLPDGGFHSRTGVPILFGASALRSGVLTLRWSLSAFPLFPSPD